MIEEPNTHASQDDNEKGDNYYDGNHDNHEI